MPWTPELSKLRDVLATLYTSPADIRRVVQDAGLNMAYLDFSQAPINIWQSILEEADKQTMVQAIIDVARRQYPNNQALAQIQWSEQRPVEGPPIGTEIPWKGPQDNSHLEKIIGLQSTLVPISFLELGLLRARSVARVVLSNGLGSGFLIPNNLLITNNHVIGDAAQARAAKVQFNYQKTVEGLDAPSEELSLLPDEVFATSASDDWTVVRVQGNPNMRWGALPLAPADPKLEDRVNIIQHPGGGYKQISSYHNVIAYVGNGRIQYLTDTLPGSSGSPVFDQQWRLVGLHHSGGHLPEPGSISLQTFWRNEGIHINTVIAGLAAAGLSPA
ncbi:MAG: trypsin-like peptidase domain-containing protein [Ardenticatenales bacterium]|nr:trypsin-like peptidase domain-containing protein [Ardenticatenales bacterium]